MDYTWYNPPMLCQDCSIKSTCVTACDELSQDLNSITMSRTYLTVSDIDCSQAWDWQPVTRLNDNDFAVVERCGLTRKQLKVIRAYYWDHWNQATIAKHYGISQQMVSKHLMYARKKIRFYLSGCL